MISLSQAIAAPEWFPDAIYADRGLIDFYRVTRQLLGQSSFLDQRMTSRAAGKEQAVFSFEELAALSDGVDMRRIGFIFHTSFCRSTLMAQALHVDGLSFSLKEPSFLLSLAESIRYTRSLREPEKARAALSALLKLATGLIGANERVIVKPTNFANNLLPFVAESGASVLLMYSDLRSYLRSLLKYGEPARAFARQLYTRLMIDCDEYRNMPAQQTLQFTDLQIAALVWKQQMGLFMKLLGTTRPGQLRTLSSEVFRDARDAALAAAFQFFEIPVTASRFQQVVSGPVFQHDSKSGTSMDNATIARRDGEIEEKYRDELAATLQWADATPIGGRINTPLPYALGLADSGAR